MTKGNRRITLPNPHGNNEIDISLVRRIVRQAGLDWADWADWADWENA